MNEMVLSEYVRMFDLLEIDAKIELMARLSENINKTFQKQKKDKNELLESLCGSWADVDDDIIEDIYSSRTISDRGIN